MPQIYKYQRRVTAGPNGTTFDFRNADQGEPAVSATYLGEVGGWHYVSVPAGTELPEQPPEIDWQPVELDHALREQLKRTRPVEMAKHVVREMIEQEIGDIHDLVSDCMRLCEFALALTLRVGSEVLTGEPMPTQTRATYTARVQSVLAAMDNGDILLRGDIEDPDQMMLRLMERYTRISQLLAAEYQPRIDELLPTSK